MTFPATDGITDRLQALFAFDASSPLIFSSGLFLFLFAGFLLVYSAFRRAPMARIVYVIAFSLYFYYKSSGVYFLLLVFAAASDFLIARGIYRARFRWTKRWLVVLSVAVNLGMLGYFKYTNFLIDISNQLLSTQALLGTINAEVLTAHVDHCVRQAFESGDAAEEEKKIAELQAVLKRLSK